MQQCDAWPATVMEIVSSSAPLATSVTLYVCRWVLILTGVHTSKLLVQKLLVFELNLNCECAASLCVRNDWE